MTDSVATRLLDALRGRLGRADVSYVDEPVRLAGGYYTDNRAFRLATDDPEWSKPLVIRLFPRESLPVQVVREARTQNALVDQGFPAARVLWHEENREWLGRGFMIMERLPGQAPLGGAEAFAVLRSLPFLLVRMPAVIARVQASLHELDVDRFTEALDGLPAGVERWLDRLDERVATDTPELGPGLRWLRENRPVERRRAVCHGDLWAGNLLLADGRVSGVLDWTVTTVADPALDVGFAAMSLSIAPIDVPRRLEGVVVRNGAWVSRRFVRAYTKRTGTDLSQQPYYEALRVVLELVGVIEHRRARAEGRDRDSPPPTWDRATDRMVAYFESRTGVRLTLPPRVA